MPATVLIGSYVWLALDHGTALLWNVVVHESGRYTLGQTILYFSHFLREVPIVLAYALFLLGASGAVAVRTRHVPGGISLAAARLAAGGAVALVGAALIVAVRTAGADSALRDLLQYRTRDDLAGYGTHWRYHLLSTIWFGAAVTLAPAALHRMTGVPLIALSRGWVRAGWLYVTALTLIFGISADVVTDPRYIGHQAREIMTHGLLTLPLGMALLMAVRSRAAITVSGTRLNSRSVQLLMAGLVLGVPLYLVVTGLGGSVMAHGQTEGGLGAMVAAHYFEHTLDYLLVLLLIAGGLALDKRRSARRSNGANGHVT